MYSDACLYADENDPVEMQRNWEKRKGNWWEKFLGKQELLESRMHVELALASSRDSSPQATGWADSKQCEFICGKWADVTVGIYDVFFFIISISFMKLGVQSSVESKDRGGDVVIIKKEKKI